MKDFDYKILNIEKNYANIQQHENKKLTKPVYMYIFLISIFMALPNHLFCGLKDIERKYDEVFLEYQAYLKGHFPVFQNDVDFFITQGKLQGLKYAIENFNSINEIQNDLPGDVKIYIEGNLFKFDDVKFMYKGHQIVPVTFDHYYYCPCKN